MCRTPVAIASLVALLAVATGERCARADSPQPTVDGAAGGGLLLLASPRFTEAEQALVEALRIYTRDLRVSVELGGQLVGRGPIAQAADLGARDGAELVVWFDGEVDAPALFAYRVTSGELRATPATPRDDPDLCAQTLALKLRALLVSRHEDLRDWSPAPASAAGGGVGLVVEAGRVGTAPAPARAVELEAGAAWRFELPNEPALARHALSARLGLSLVRLPVDLALDGGYAFRAESAGAAGRAGVADIPIGVGASLRLRRAWYQLSAGPRLALHLLTVDASTPDGRAATQFAAAAGLGGGVEARLRLGDRAALFLSAAAEALLPRHRFLVDNSAFLDLGPYLLQLGAGVVVRLW